MSVAAAIDTDGVAVITGGASGFGLTVAERLAGKGMRVAVLDVSADELKTAEAKLKGVAGADRVCALRCDVGSFSEVKAAQAAVAAAFPGNRVSFLFNNAGIHGQNPGQIVAGDAVEAWPRIFSVNVFGAVHTLKAFLPSMIDAGPLPSGKKTLVVTTSSVVGLLNHNLGPYSVSKMAATAVAEQLSLELQAMGEPAAHISPHSLHPTVAATNFLGMRDADGSKMMGDDLKEAFLKFGTSSADDIINGLFKGLDEGKYYIVVDHALDIATSKQIAKRMEDQMAGRRPRKPEQLGMLLMMDDMEAFKERKKKLSQGTATMGVTSDHSVMVGLLPIGARDPLERMALPQKRVQDERPSTASYDIE
eukprot:CAMPEP_0197894570 /NCGR_PEP_ID=MMETSP1439-20131203/35892_1 /TAXON_ID=66791 /ORGANISM="Gonyaulax spinifera, Strain CCMP409" /LENGTH=362 /DNA_ID=CAMNT_0043514933 /DNA_START=39 /DNA_END=1125 /DNA_ORIENTATION=-